MFVIGDYQEHFDAGHGHNEFKGENISSSGCLCWHPSSKSPTSILLVNIGWFGWFVWRWDYSDSYSHEGTYFKNFVKFAIHTSYWTYSKIGLNQVVDWFSLEIDILGLKTMVKSSLEFFILKFTKPLQSCCCPVQKICPGRQNWPGRLALSLKGLV